MNQTIHAEDLNVNSKQYDSIVRTVLNVLTRMSFDDAIATIADMFTDEKERSKFVNNYAKKYPQLLKILEETSEDG
ncbi:MAG: hypothetical protein LBC65_04620 [Oscillospiraceae bacterium]|jgi:chemotaxis regulatin CheY-phosphate phosphatase CheZ|nr:hypothetical protein [Oscillospiraceae bacterium]